MIKTEKQTPEITWVKKEREYGVDLLRIVSMFMVVVLHMLGNGGILDTAEPLSVNYSVSWLLETFAFCAVNCYGLISGYVGLRSKYRYSGLMTLWLQVLFYTVGITFVFYFLKPELVTPDKIKAAFLPVLSYQYWYFSAYFALFFLIPVLNIIVEKMPKKNLTAVLIAILILFSVLQVAFGCDVFSVGNGYSTIWLAVLYVLGAYFKKYETLKKIKPVYWILIYVASVIITWLSKMSMETLNMGASDILVNYLSPTMVLAGISLFAFFVHIKPGRVMSKIISKISPLAFGVYLIHVHPFMWGVMTYKLTHLAKGPVLKLVLGVLSVSLSVFLVCIIIDFIRSALFNALKIKKRFLASENRVLGDFWDI